MRADRLVDAEGVPLDGLSKLGVMRGRSNFVIRGSWSPEADVLRERAGEEHRILRHVCDCGAEGFSVNVGEGCAAEPPTRRLLRAQAVGVAIVVILLAASLLIGSRPISLAEFGAALSGNGSAELRTLLWEVRLPRTIAAALVGVALAWAGTLMQAMTRNPLADPGLLGVSAGSAFAVVLSMSWLGVTSATGIAGAAVVGAAIMTALVLILGLFGNAAGGVRLILAGVALSMNITGIQTVITLLNPRALDAMRAWSVGSLASPDTDVLRQSAPVLVIGAALALLLARPLDTLALGDDVARALGSHPVRARAMTGAAAACLVGAATAIAGPISFIGLLVPHLVRPFTGPSTGRVLVASTIAGAALFLCADVLARTVLWPGELPVGVVSAAIGAPVMLLVLRRSR